MLFTEKSVLDFGAKGDGVTNDHAAFQKALDSGAGYLYVPVGKYVIGGTLTLHSDTRLRLHPEAVMFWGNGSGQNASSHLITNEKGARNIAVEGGIWDGNTVGNPRIPMDGEDVGYLGIPIEFRDMEGLSLMNMTVRNSESFHIRLNYVKNFRIEEITFDDQIHRVNQDGVHLAGGCENGVIRKIRGNGVSSANDDMIALITDVTLENMWLGDPARGQRPGPIRNIVIEDLYADNTFSFLRLMSEQEPLENISVRNVRGGCYYLGVQMQISPYVREKESAKGQRGVGKLKNITLSDWRIYHRQPYGMDIDWQKRADASVDGMIDMEEMVENLTIDHFVREYDKDNRPDLPTLYIKNDVENRIELIGADNTLLKLDGQEYQGRFILKETTPADGITELYGDIDYLHFE
ncbi:MAG: hypothetical protein IJD11_00910 [Oscillospiraceae bacterium]|nr:hypothetical protein [Oscillospiraceae bacterium]